MEESRIDDLRRLRLEPSPAVASLLLPPSSSSAAMVALQCGQRKKQSEFRETHTRSSSRLAYERTHIHTQTSQCKPARRRRPRAGTPETTSQRSNLVSKTPSRTLGRNSPASNSSSAHTAVKHSRCHRSYCPCRCSSTFVPCCLRSLLYCYWHLVLLVLL